MSLKMTRGSKKAILQMKNLWREAFSDDEEFIDAFFENFYRPRKTFLIFDDDELVSMLYYMDVSVKYDGRRVKCAYLYGVATKLSERRQGHFKKLHNAFLEEMSEKKYDAIIVIPQNEGLFSLYKDLGYTIPLRRCEYELSSIDITPASDLREVWLYKKALHKSCRSGFSLIESEKQFFETVREHKIFSYDGGYLAFYKKNGAYKLYSIISSDPLHAPASLVHYERSALIFNITNKLDAEKMEKEKPSLPFLMS